MASAILLVGGGLWALAGALGLAVALAGTDRLAELLPPLSIDHEALGRTIAALAIGCLAVSACHVVVGVGLRRPGRWMTSAGALLAAVMSATFLATGVAAFTSGAAATMDALAAVGSGAAALLIAGGYAVGTALLIGHLRRPGSAD